MNKEEWTLQEIVKQYHGEAPLSEKEKKDAEDFFDGIDEDELLDRCHKVIEDNEDKVWRIGHL